MIRRKNIGIICLICVVVLLIIFASYRTGVAKVTSARDMYISGMNSISKTSSIISSPIVSSERVGNLLTVTYKNNVVLKESIQLAQSECWFSYKLINIEDNLSNDQVERFIKEHFSDDCLDVAENFLNAYQNNESYEETFESQGMKINASIKTTYESERVSGKKIKSVRMVFVYKLNARTYYSHRQACGFSRLIYNKN